MRLYETTRNVRSIVYFNWVEQVFGYKSLFSPYIILTIGYCQKLTVSERSLCESVSTAESANYQLTMLT